MTDEDVKESALALLLYMDTVATAAKMGNSLAQPYLDADAIRIMPDGVCIYQERSIFEGDGDRDGESDTGGDVMRVALNAAWTVTAGVIPGIIEGEHTKQWLYTSEHREEDEANAKDGKDTNNFTGMMKEAHDYALQITNPAYLNWVRVEFMWL